jgi:hypothetical protein
MASQIARSTEPFFKPFKGPKVSVRTPLRKESEKRQIERVEYTEKRKAYLQVHPFCEFEGCTKLASEIHHRARRGANYLDVSTFFAICRNHHRFLHDNPAEAKEMGLLV